MAFIIPHRLVDPDDPQGRTYREINLAKPHAFALGTLVEIVEWDEDEYVQRKGVRLFVVGHNRDCDGSPIYSLSDNGREVGLFDDSCDTMHWINGVGEEWLRAVT
jgi:hypothetical protein